MPHDIVTLFSLIGGTQQHILVASSSTIHTIPNQTSFKTHSHSLPRHPLRTLRYHFSLSLSQKQWQPPPFPSSLSLFLSLSTNPEASHTPQPLFLSLHLVLSRFSPSTAPIPSHAVLLMDQTTPTTKTYQLKRVCFLSHFCFQILSFSQSNKLCFQKLIFDRFLQNFQRFLQSWILIRYVKSFPTGGSLSN
jgi:hypothetical protein